MLEDIKNFVQKTAESCDDGYPWYFVIHKEFVDGIVKWLDEYINSEEGDWLDYTVEQSQNEEFMYVLILSIY